MDQFNDERTYIKEMIELLNKLIKDRLKQTIEFALETHTAEPLKKLLKILDKYKF